tara:strand:- start:336 stop:512 length:177 start_codon:yes stop_codon:yes gene_type:complete
VVKELLGKINTLIINWAKSLSTTIYKNITGIISNPQNYDKDQLNDIDFGKLFLFTFLN